MLSYRRQQDAAPCAHERRQFMRKRYQKGSLEKLNGVWIARWYENGCRRARTLERVSKMTKTQAQAELASIVAPLNARETAPSKDCSFDSFVKEIYLPF